jgi:heme-binding NEAT domain protein
MKKSLIALLVVLALVISVSAFSVSAENTAVAPANETETASTNLDGLEDEQMNVKSIMKDYFGK